MSKHETWRTRKYWDSVGGLLIEEFRAVKESKIPNQENRYMDAVIVLNEPRKIHNQNTYNLFDKDIIVVQTKKDRIGMYLLGQAYFSKFLLEKFKPRSIKTVAICGHNDAVMAELALEHGVEIVVIPECENPDKNRER
jgi:hypothetical protein